MSVESPTSTPSLVATIGAGITRIKNFVGNTLFILLILFLVVAALSTCRSVEVPENSALVLNPTGTIVELRSVQANLLSLMPGSAIPQETELATLLTAIDRAASDGNIKMLVLNLENLSAISPAQASRLGVSIEQFKATGKKVLSYADYYTQGQFHVASFADEIYMHPFGQILFTGYGGSTFYLKDILDRFKVNVHVFRVGEYKSAVEPMLRNSMSEESRLASEQLYQELWQHFVADVAQNRTLANHQVQSYADEISTVVGQTKGDLARAALESHLVDELMTPDQARVRMAATVGYADSRRAQINAIDYQTYLAASAAQEPPEGAFIDIITVQGAITLDGDISTTANANVLVDLIHQSRTDPETAAIVLRVDSPGGSQFASELIRQELELAQLAGMPVVASFGSAAASGGYWVSATADEIVSEATTITGSIGIFSLLLTFEKTLEEFGIHTDGVGTSVNTTGMSQFTGINANMAGLFQAQVDHGYEQFLNLVAKGRDKTVAEIQGVASGRVWSGEAAYEVGLVDHLGGLDQALKRAAALASLDNWQSRRVRQPQDPRSELLAALTQIDAAYAKYSDTSQPSLWSRTALASAPDLVLETLARQLKQLKWLKDPKHLHVICTECVLPHHDLGGL